jgi:hypothetical protein
MTQGLDRVLLRCGSTNLSQKVSLVRSASSVLGLEKEVKFSWVEGASTVCSVPHLRCSQINNFWQLVQANKESGKFPQWDDFFAGLYVLSSFAVCVYANYRRLFHASLPLVDSSGHAVKLLSIFPSLCVLFFPKRRSYRKRLRRK